MPLWLAARRIITLVLIATLVPAQGLAWPLLTRDWRAADRPMDAVSFRAFMKALNATDQMAMTGPGRPQLYLVYNVDLEVPPAGNAPLITAADRAWLDETIAALVKQLSTESILDEIEAGDAHIRSMQSATRLASMPDSVPFDGDSVNVEQTMRVAITDALQEAGFEGNGSTKSGAGTVTYTDSLADGDIVVTGRLVDGQIVLTKEFKPLTGGGDVGDPVRIRGTGASNPTQTGATQNAPQTTGPPTASTTPPAATPLVSSPSAYNKALIGELETKVRVITPNQTNAALMGQINIRDTHVAQMNNMANRFETLLKNPAELDTVVQGLRNGAEAVDNAYQNMLGAERALATLQGQNPRVDLKGTYEADMRRAAQLEASGNATAANQLRTQAANTAYGNFVQRQQAFYQALDQNPLLGLGERSLVGPDDFLFKKLRNTLSYSAPNSDYVSLARPYFERAATEARAEAARAGAIDTAEGFTEFGGPKYDRTRDVMDAEGQANGSNLQQQLGQAAQGAYEQIEGGRAIRTEITNFGLNLVAGTAWVIPFIGPFISGGAAAIQVVREGDDLVVAVLDAEDARNLANVTGYTRIITAEDRVAAERGEFVLSVAGLALEGLQGIKVVKGPLPSGAGDVGTAAVNTTADATTTAVRNAPTAGAAPTTPPAGAKPTNTPAPSAFNEAPVIPEVVDASGKVTGAKVNRLSDAEIAQLNADELAELTETYNDNLARARAAGVSEDRIKQIIGDGDITDEVANKLYREVTAAEGKVNIPLSEYEALTGIDVRNQAGNLSEADYQFLRDKLAQDPNYIDRLPNRGRMPQGSDLGDGFNPGLTAAQRDALLQNPRVAQMVDEAKAAAATGAAADGTGTVLVPRGATSGTAPAGAGVADNTGTVILPAGAKPSPGNPTVRDPNMTTLDPNQTTLDPNQTVIIDPNKTTLIPPPTPPGPATAPTVRLDPSDATPTVRLDPSDATPTVRLGPEATAPTVRLGPEATAPTVRLGPEATAPTVRLDPKATAQATEQLTQSLPKVRQSGQSPQQAANTIRSAMSRLGVGPQQLVTSLRERFSPRPVSFAGLGNSAPGSDVGVSIEALGVSSGEAFNVTAANNGKMPIQLHGEGVVVEPVRGAAPVANAGTPAASVAMDSVEAFCLERARPVAPPGTQYRVAPPAVQAQHRSLVDVLHAAKRVMDASGLHPDSEVKSYFNFVRQWSIWSRQENFDEKRFTEAFVNQTKKNVESQNVKWTGAMQSTVRKAAPGRWRDIAAILLEAGTAKRQAAGAVEIAAGPATLVATIRRRHHLGEWS